MLLFILAVIFLHPVIFGGKALLPAKYLATMQPWNDGTVANTHSQWNPLQWDGIAQFYPWRVHYSRSISEGSIPLWNPHQFCGTPFAANAQTAIYYPLNLLFVIFSPLRAFGLSALLHLFLAGAFTYLLARRLGLGQLSATVAGIVFEFSAFMVLWLELPTLICVATWLPLALYFILRASNESSKSQAVFAGVALGLSILAGHFQIATYVFMAAGLWWVWLIASKTRQNGRNELLKGVGLAFIAFAIAFLIAAPQILPTVELAGMSHRVRATNAENYAHFVANGIPGRNLITLFVPNFYGNPALNNYQMGSAADFMEFGLYIGILPLLLAIIGAIYCIRQKFAGFFTFLAGISLLLAFGTVLNIIPYYLIPGTSALGGPGRTIVLFCFSAAMIAGFGVQWFADHAMEIYVNTKRKMGWRALATVTAVFGIGFFASHYVALSGIASLGIDPQAVMTMAQGQLISFGTMAIAGLVILSLYTAGYVSKHLLAGLAIVAIVADLFSFGMSFNPTASPDQVYPETKLTKWIENDAGEAHIMPINSKWGLYDAPSAILPPNAATVYGFYDTQGYDSLFSKHYKEFVDERLGMDSSPQENGNMVFFKTYTPDWPAGMAGYVLSTQPIKATSLKSETDIAGVNVYKQANYQDAYVLREAGFSKPVSRAWLEPRVDTNTITASASTNTESRLVVADTYYPGWTANVDGIDTPVLMAQDVFKSVIIESGDHVVTFSYLPGTFVTGVFLGLVGILFVGITVGSKITKR